MPDVFVAPKIDKPRPEKKRKERKARIGLRKKESSSLAAFVVRPDNLRFETQERKERIVLLLRRHFITNIPWLLIALFLAFCPLIIGKIIPLDFIPRRYLLMIIVVWYLLVFAFVFERFLSWFFNVNIVTDERIVDIDFPSILYKEISDTKIDKIQDVTVRMGGFVRGLFNFGDVLIQTAGTIPEFEFSDVPRPEKVARILNDLILEEEQEKLEGRAR